MPSHSDSAPEPKSTQLNLLRDRLVSNNVLMRYDYAWKEIEFSHCESRLVGVACRLLYLHGMWRQRCQEHESRIMTEAELVTGTMPIDDRATSVYIEGNGFEEFDRQMRRACELMGCKPLEDCSNESLQQAHMAFVYVAPPQEERVENQFEALKRVLSVAPEQSEKNVHQTPVVCCLLGETDFLGAPADAEQERVRGLSGFALSQRLQQVTEEAKAHTITHFAVEFTPQGQSSDDCNSSASFDSTNQLHGLMNRFGASGRNLSQHTEKWEVFAPKDSLLAQNERLVTACNEEESYWVDFAQDKTCHQCHALNAALFRCSRCQKALYCSRECQKAAWKLHKPFCTVPGPVQA